MLWSVAPLGAEMVTTEVSAMVSPWRTAMTRNVPSVLPAVKRPEPLMVPPVADQFTFTGVVVPLLIRPVAANCIAELRRNLRYARAWRAAVTAIRFVRSMF